MNNTMRAMLIASFALAFTACKKEEAAPVAEAQQALVAPDANDDAGWCEPVRQHDEQDQRVDSGAA